jgi:hypothetical protein
MGDTTFGEVSLAETQEFRAPLRTAATRTFFSQHSLLVRYAFRSRFLFPWARSGQRTAFVVCSRHDAGWRYGRMFVTIFLRKQAKDEREENETDNFLLLQREDKAESSFPIGAVHFFCRGRT